MAPPRKPWTPLRPMYLLMLPGLHRVRRRLLERRAVGRRRQPLHAGDAPSTLTKGEGCVAADARAVVLRAGGTLCEPARTLANEVTSLHFCHTGGSAVRYVWSLA